MARLTFDIVEAYAKRHGWYFERRGPVYRYGSNEHAPGMEWEDQALADAYAEIYWHPSTAAKRERDKTPPDNPLPVQQLPERPWPDHSSGLTKDEADAADDAARNAV